jgi:uncharacterized Zn-binding protein involved in type VI secretion
MPGIVRTNADSHQGHSGFRVPFHKTYYTGGSPDVFVNNEHAVRQGDSTVCGDGAQGGSGSVFVNNKPVHRAGDGTTGHGNWTPNSAASGSDNVIAN